MHRLARPAGYLKIHQCNVTLRPARRGTHPRATYTYSEWQKCLVHHVLYSGTGISGAVNFVALLRYPERGGHLAGALQDKNQRANENGDG